MLDTTSLLMTQLSMKRIKKVVDIRERMGQLSDVIPLNILPNFHPVRPRRTSNQSCFQPHLLWNVKAGWLHVFGNNTYRMT